MVPSRFIDPSLAVRKINVSRSASCRRRSTQLLGLFFAIGLFSVSHANTIACSGGQVTSNGVSTGLSKISFTTTGDSMCRYSRTTSTYDCSGIASGSATYSFYTIYPLQCRAY
jgi:hypothetical protein